VAQILELAQLLQHDGVAEVDVGGRRVQAELDAQLPSLALGEGELGLQAPARKGVGGVAGEVRGGVRGVLGHPAQC
jgi:hypothetical protein